MGLLSLRRYIRLVVSETRMARVPNQLIEPGDDQEAGAEEGADNAGAGRPDKQPTQAVGEARARSPRKPRLGSGTIDVWDDHGALADALTRKTGVPVSAHAVGLWLGGDAPRYTQRGEAARVVDRAASRLIPPHVRSELFGGTLIAMVAYVAGLGPRRWNGIDLQAILDKPQDTAH